MTGPEHYTEAERLLRWAEDVEPERAASAVAAAQAHATLALTAATALGDGYDEFNAWHKACGVKRT